jgi:hypothetical protein
VTALNEIQHILNTIPCEDYFCAASHVDLLELHQNMSRCGVIVMLHRAYRRAAERCDLDAKAGWVKFRELQNLGSGE